MGFDDVQPHHVQAAAVGFVVLGILCLAANPTTSGAGEQSESRFPNSLIALFMFGSVVLYLPALRVGYLSDDFVLIPRAEAGQFGAVSSALFRPFVLGIWAVLRAVGSEASGLHLFNVALHGICGFLAARTVAGWTRSKWSGVLGGAAFLSHPMAVEPVVWIAGAFDVVATFFILAAVQVARGYGDSPPVSRRVVLVLLALAAVLSKETACVLGLLIFIDQVVLRTKSTVLFRDLGIITICSILYAAVRLHGTSEASAFSLTKYMLQRAVFQTFGALAQPWSDQSRGTFVAIASLGIVMLLMFRLASRGDRHQLRNVASFAAWIIASIVPVIGWIMIGGSLDGSRYLYLALPAWSGLLIMTAEPGSERGKVASRLAVFVIIFLNIVVVNERLAAWQRGGAIRDRILAGLKNDVRVASCESIRIDGLPDTIDGVYVLRNGAQEMIAANGLPKLSANSSAACQFVWSSAGGIH